MLMVALTGGHACKFGILTDALRCHHGAPAPLRLAQVNRLRFPELQIHREFAVTGLLNMDA